VLPDAAAGPILAVLQSPQDLVNIASAVRIAKNFALDGLRLVEPAEFDAWRIEGIAHNTADLIARVKTFATLDEAVADCVWVVGLTARGRAAKRSILRPREAAAELVEHSASGPVAFVAGREDKGLSNEELDRCHALVTIPVNPDYRSLNLAQAVAILSYEIWMCRSGADQPVKRPRRVADPSTAEQLERLFEDWGRALTAIDFFKTRQPEYVMRSWREILYRSGLDGREAALVRAMGIEVQRCLERNGIPVPPRPPKGER
jgi:TrmH family RNA methyltransferase